MTEIIMDLSTIWQQAAFVFPHFHRCGVDWDECYRIYLDRVARTKTVEEHALLLAEFINSLGDGHTDISFSRDILDEAGYLPFEIQYAGGAYYSHGKRILGFNNRSMEQILDEAARYVYRVGDFVPRLAYILPFLLKSGENTVQFAGKTEVFFLSPEHRPAKYRKDTEFSNYGDILRIRFDDLLLDRSVTIREKLLAERPRAVILDIRENIGGMTKYGADIAQLFLPGKFSGCKKWTRAMVGVDYASASQTARMDEEELQRIMGNKGNAGEEIERCRRISGLCYFKEYEDCWGEEDVQAVFDGPVALLTSRKTVSAAEDFAAFFRSNSRGILIGEPTCGTSGTPLLKKLSCGTLRVCSVGYQLLDGTEFIGKGIQPDMAVSVAEVDMLSGRDPVLACALRHLK